MYLNVGSGFASILRDIPGNAVYFATYEGMKRWLTPADKTTPNISGFVISGGCAGVCYWTAIYPLDTNWKCLKKSINTRQQNYSLPRIRHKKYPR